MAFAAPQARAFKEVFPKDAAQTAKPGEPLGESALNRVMDHLQKSTGHTFSPTERTAWLNEARELSKGVGTEDGVWSKLFTKLHDAQGSTSSGASVLPTNGAQAAKPGEPLDESALNRVMDHLQKSTGHTFNSTERTAWLNEARELSKEVGTEDGVWSKLFTKLHNAQGSTSSGASVLPTNGAQTAKPGEPLGESALNRVMDHLQKSTGYTFNPTERTAWLNEARELSKEVGTEDGVWSKLFTKLHNTQVGTSSGANALSTNAAETAKPGEPLGESALNRVMDHLQKSTGHTFNPTERTAWLNEARELSKTNGTEDGVWSKLFTKLHDAQGSTPAGANVLPTSGAQTAKPGEPLDDSALNRVMDHLQKSFNRQLTPNEYTAWRNEAREYSKSGASEDGVWSAMFSKLFNANRNVNGE